MEGERVLFLVVAWASHAVVGYALVRGFTDADPRIGIVFGLLPDVDFWFPASWGWPFVHHGLTPTPLFAAAVVAGTYAIYRDRTGALAVGLAIGSHIAIDSLSPKGVPWLFPIETSPSPGIHVHGPTATALLWAAAIGVLVWRSDGRLSVR